MLQNDVSDLFSGLKKFKGRRLSFVNEQMQTVIRCVRNDKTEKELNYLWKIFKKIYLNVISKKNPYFLLGMNHFIVDVSLVLEMKRKYFNNNEPLSENVESTADLHIIKMFEILIELCSKCFVENKIQETQMIGILSSFNNAAISRLKEAELQLGGEVLKPYTFYSIMKMIFEEWYGVYATNPLECIEKYNEKEKEIEEEDEEKNDSETEPTNTNETNEEVLNE